MNECLKLEWSTLSLSQEKPKVTIPSRTPTAPLKSTILEQVLKAAPLLSLFQTVNLNSVIAEIL
jgi:hypothetical protein